MAYASVPSVGVVPAKLWSVLGTEAPADRTCCSGKLGWYGGTRGVDLTHPWSDRGASSESGAAFCCCVPRFFATNFWGGMILWCVSKLCRTSALNDELNISPAKARQGRQGKARQGRQAGKCCVAQVSFAMRCVLSWRNSRWRHCSGRPSPRSPSRHRMRCVPIARGRAARPRVGHAACHACSLCSLSGRQALWHGVLAGLGLLGVALHSWVATEFRVLPVTKCIKLCFTASRCVAQRTQTIAARPRVIISLAHKAAPSPTSRFGSPTQEQAMWRSFM